MINIYSYPPLAAGSIILALGVFVFTQNKYAALNRIFAIMCLSIFIWLGSYSFVFSSKTTVEAMIWIHPVYLGVIFIPVTVHHLSLVYLDRMNKINRRLVIVSYCMGLGMIGLTHLDGFFNGVPKY